MRHHYLIEALLKFTPQPRNPSLSFLRQLLLRRAILHSVHRLARLVLKVSQQALQLLLQLANFLALLLHSLGRQTAALARHLLLDRPALLRGQLRAMIRAAAGRDLRVMLPMVSTGR